MDPQDEDVMQVEGAAAPDRRFDAKGKIDIKAGYNFKTGFGTEPLTQLWTKGLVNESDDGHLIFVNFNVWQTLVDDAPRLDYEKHTIFPFLWRNKHIIAELSKKKLCEDINNVVALTSIPVLMYTPLLFLMLNGIRAGKMSTDVPGHSRIILSTDVSTCYLQVSTLLLASRSDHVLKFGRIVQKNYDANLHKLSMKLQDCIETDPDYLEYGKHLQELVRTQKLESLAVQTDDEAILTRVATYLISYQMNWMHLLELQILTLSDPALATAELKPKDLGSDFYSKTALPLADPQMLYYDVAQPLEPNLITEQVRYLRLRAAHMDAKRFVPNTFSTEQKIGGISAHFLRTFILVMVS